MQGTIPPAPRIRNTLRLGHVECFSVLRMRIQPILTITDKLRARHERGYVYVYAGAQLKRYYWAGLYRCWGAYADIQINRRINSNVGFCGPSKGVGFLTVRA